MALASNLRLRSAGYPCGWAVAISCSEECSPLVESRKRPSPRQVRQPRECGSVQGQLTAGRRSLQPRGLAGAEASRVLRYDSRVLLAGESSRTIRPAPISRRSRTPASEAGPATCQEGQDLRRRCTRPREAGAGDDQLKSSRHKRLCGWRVRKDVREVQTFKS